MGTSYGQLSLKECVEIYRKSLTMDNGPEFARHYLPGDLHDVKTWFCDPYSPWRKGGVENTMGRLRRYLPGKTGPAKLNFAGFMRLAAQHNSTPGKCPGFLTPEEVLLNKKPQRVALQT